MLKKITLALMIGALSNSAFAIKALEDLRAESETKDGWRLAKYDRRHNIKAYVKNEDGKSIRSFKVEALFDYPIDVVARLQSDVDNYKRWYFEVLESKLLKKISNTEFIFYLVHNAPVGLADRDVVMKATIEPMTSKKPYVIIKMVSLRDYLPTQKPYERMETEDYIIKLTPQGDNKTLLESEGFIDPGATAPSWAVNFIQGKAPYTNMMGMRRMMAMPQYQDKKAPITFTFFE